MSDILPRLVTAALIALLITACASNDNPPCRRVTATDFMRPHTFKGIATDEFIGVTTAPPHFRPKKSESKAFKKIWEMGFFHGWAVIWCPAEELPNDYLSNVRSHPNRNAHEGSFTHE